MSGFEEVGWTQALRGWLADARPAARRCGRLSVLSTGDPHVPHAMVLARADSATKRILIPHRDGRPFLSADETATVFASARFVVAQIPKRCPTTHPETLLAARGLLGPLRLRRRLLVSLRKRLLTLLASHAQLLSSVEAVCDETIAGGS